MEDLISIIIPVFNSAKDIHAALTSIAGQSSLLWECILIDDGSTDESPEICASFISADSRFRYFKREIDNKGANTCRNIGLQYSRSNYIIFMDADDLLESSCIENRLSFLLEHQGYDLIVFSTAIVNEECEVIDKFGYVDKSSLHLLCDFLSHNIPWHTMSPLWSKTFLNYIGGWNESYPRLQDVELCIRALLLKPSYLLVDGKVDSYYRKPEMTNLKINDTLIGFNQLINDYCIDILSNCNWKAYEDQIKEAFVSLIERILRFYVGNSDKVLFDWESSFIKTLRTIEFDSEDIKYIENIFQISINDREQDRKIQHARNP